MAHLAALAVMETPCPVDDGVIGAVIQNDSAANGAPGVLCAEAVQTLEDRAVLAHVAPR